MSWDFAENGKRPDNSLLSSVKRDACISSLSIESIEPLLSPVVSSNEVNVLRYCT